MLHTQEMAQVLNVKPTTLRKKLREHGWTKQGYRYVFTDDDVPKIAQFIAQRIDLSARRSIKLISLKKGDAVLHHDGNKVHYGVVVRRSTNKSLGEYIVLETDGEQLTLNTGEFYRPEEGDKDQL